MLIVQQQMLMINERTIMVTKSVLIHLLQTIFILSVVHRRIRNENLMDLIFPKISMKNLMKHMLNFEINQILIK